VDFQGKRTFVRVDFNVPLGPDRAVADDFRIRSSLATVRHILSKGGRPVLACHLGRPRASAFLSSHWRLSPAA